MKRNKNLIVAAAGLAVGTGGIALAAGTVVNMSGATLLQNFCIKPAAYNDFIDVDGNGISGNLGTGIQGLAPAADINGYWVFVYRSSGSGNGFRDLVNHGLAFDITPAGDDIGICGAPIAPEADGTPTSRPLEIIDEHYYNTASFFIANAAKYDSYNRSGPKIYVGEFAVTSGGGQVAVVKARSLLVTRSPSFQASTRW